MKVEGTPSEIAAFILEIRAISDSKITYLTDSGGQVYKTMPGTEHEEKTSSSEGVQCGMDTEVRFGIG